MPENNCELFAGLVIGDVSSRGAADGVIVSIADAPDIFGKTGTHSEAGLNAVKIPVWCAADAVNRVRSAGLEAVRIDLKPLASFLGAVSGAEKNAGCISVNAV